MLLLILGVFSLFLMSGMRHASAQGNPFDPKYSYLATCPVHDYAAATGTLTAQCYRELNAGSLTTSLPFLGCDPNADIRNEDGTLYCTAPSGAWGEGHVLPAGSYQQTCWQMGVMTSVGPHHTKHVFLSGICAINLGGGNQGHTGASIDLIAQQCAGRDIWNGQGVLRCDVNGNSRRNKH
jgi:hypothetical protein